jgi:cytoskeletal protein RodZ
MERLGERLRRRRIELGLGIEDIAEATRFRPEVIQAVEEGRPAGVFPAQAYLNAFLRAYAAKLDLDPDTVVTDQKSEEERVREAIRGLRIKPRPRRAPRKAVLWVALVIAAVAAVYFGATRLGGWGEEQGGREEAARGGRERPGAGPRDTARTAGSMEAGTDSAGEEVSGSEAGPSGPGITPSLSGELETARVNGGSDDVAGEEGETSAEEAPPPAPETAGEEGEPETPDSPAEESDDDDAGRLALSEGAASRLEVKVSRSSYLTLESGGEVLIDGYLEAGDSMVFTSEEDFEIVVLNDRRAVSFVKDGGPVDLPSTPDLKILNFTIPVTGD